MKIQIIGAGVVGKATGHAFQRYGHLVVFKDKGDVLEDADVHFICVPEKVVENIIIQLQDIKGLSVIRSTVLPGTTKQLSEKYTMHICHNPEFLREAIAEYDFLNSEYILIGQCCIKHGDILEMLYKPFNIPIVRVKPRISEMVKLVSNAHLAMLISFWNEIHQISENYGDSHYIGSIASMNSRISTYGARMHGKAFGGHCLPKDINQLIGYAESIGYNPKLLKAVKQVNNDIRKDILHEV